MKCKSLVLKVSSKCNLNCKYCYVYNMGDESYRYQPKRMRYSIVDAVIEKAKNHCTINEIKSFLFAFHGGEPLLQTKEFYTYFIERVNSVFGNSIQVYYTLQTNGTLLTSDWGELFSKLKIQVGISLDGLEDINDLNRIYRNGKGSFNDVIRGINNAMKYEFHQKTLGILTVINTKNDPIEFYNFAKGLKVKNIDFLFPYNHYNNLPEGYIVENKETIYADWLIKIFDYWLEDNSKNRIFIRMFDGFIRDIFGQEYPTDLFGSYANELLVIETDGKIEAVDYLKSCGNNFTKTNLNILNNELSDSVQDELIRLYYNSHKYLNYKCLECPIKTTCGGGNLTSRYSKDSGFDNPSFMCKDFLKFIIHVQNKVLKSLPDSILKEQNVKLLNYDEINQYFNQKDYSIHINKYLRNF